MTERQTEDTGGIHENNGAKQDKLHQRGDFTEQSRRTGVLSDRGVRLASDLRFDRGFLLPGRLVLILILQFSYVVVVILVVAVV